MRIHISFKALTLSVFMWGGRPVWADAKSWPAGSLQNDETTLSDIQSRKSEHMKIYLLGVNHYYGIIWYTFDISVQNSDSNIRYQHGIEYKTPCAYRVFMFCSQHPSYILRPHPTANPLSYWHVLWMRVPTCHHHKQCSAIHVAWSIMMKHIDHVSKAISP